MNKLKQFYEKNKGDKQLSAMARVLPWTHNTTIFSRCKSPEERRFYLALCHKEKYSSRELERQIDAASFERASLSPSKLSAALRVIQPAVDEACKDQYMLEFLGLPELHSENDLKRALVRHMKAFVLELGKDFLFVSEEYRLQVGNQDFYIDLLFYHRNLSALVAFELKIGQFKPEHMGPKPSIGVLLCRDKDDEVVEYALSRNLSPALVAQYQLQLPDKKLLRSKLHELLAQEWALTHEK
jgi:predicted nuclease of restriction endonuclease-like (RecB) superfamily